MARRTAPGRTANPLPPDDPPAIGRPPSYKAEHARQAKWHCLLGATNPDLAKLFDVSLSTVESWLRDHPTFARAVKAGREEADAKVTRRLYERARGYSHSAVKIFCNKDGAVTQVPYVEHYPPDTTAAIFWLKNRQRSKWRDRMEFVEVDWDKMSDEQVAAIAEGTATVRPEDAREDAASENP